MGVALIHEVEELADGADAVPAQGGDEQDQEDEEAQAHVLACPRSPSVAGIEPDLCGYRRQLFLGFHCLHYTLKSAPDGYNEAHALDRSSPGATGAVLG